MLDKFIAEYSEKGYTFAYRLCGNAEQANSRNGRKIFGKSLHFDFLRA